MARRKQRPRPDDYKATAAYHRLEARRQAAYALKLERSVASERELARSYLKVGRWFHQRGDHAEELIYLANARGALRLSRQATRLAPGYRQRAQGYREQARRYDDMEARRQAYRASLA